MATPSLHRLRAWRVAKKVSRADFCKQVRDRGGQLNLSHLDHIEAGRRHPSYELCVAIQKATGDDIDIAYLRSYPLSQYKGGSRAA